MSKIQYIIATPNKKQFYKITEWESDMTGYGGSTSTEYKYELTKDINKASVFDSDPSSIMYRYDNREPFIILKVKTTLEIISD